MVWPARWARADMAVVKQTLDLIDQQSWARKLTIQIYTAGNGAAVGELYDYVKAAVSLESSNSFPWPKDCVQIQIGGWADIRGISIAEKAPR